jgi:hypothetical protein
MDFVVDSGLMTFLKADATLALNLTIMRAILLLENKAPREQMNNCVPRDFIIHPQGHQLVRGAHVEIMRNHKTFKLEQKLWTTFSTLPDPH